MKSLRVAFRAQFPRPLRGLVSLTGDAYSSAIKLRASHITTRLGTSVSGYGDNDVGRPVKASHELESELDQQRRIESGIRRQRRANRLEADRWLPRRD